MLCRTIVWSKIIKYKKRKLKPSELLKATTVSNPISQADIDRTIKSKENGKHFDVS